MFRKIGVRYRWYLLLRLVIVSSIPLMGILSRIRGIQINLIPHIVIFLLSFLMSVTFYFILRKGLNRIIYYYLQMMFDNLLIFAILYFTGGTNSIFEILYFVNIVTGSFFLFAKGGFSMAVMSTVGYSLILFGEYFGFIVSPYKPVPYRDIMLENLIIKAFIYVLSFFLTAAISGFLSEKIQIRSSEEIARIRLRLRDIIEHIPLSLIILNDAMIVTDFNRKSRDLFKGIDYNKKFTEIDEELAPLVKQQKRYQFNRGNEYYSMTAEKISYKGKYDDFFIVVISDITDMIEYEKRLITKEKMEVIGELSASIAHELKNPLSNIKGSAEALFSEESLPERKNHPMYHILLEEVERTDGMVKDFLEYTQTRQINCEQIELKQFLREIIAVMNNGEITDISGVQESSTVVADAKKLKQVLSNLITNAIEAAMETPEPKVKIVHEREDHFDVIRIIDNGKGIDEKAAKRMFQPFNTTKSRGTGLGLAISYKIIKDEHRGEMEFMSKSGETVFSLKLRRNIV